MAVFLSIPFNGRTQESVSALATISVNIIAPLTATEALQLNFGRFYPGNSGGSIVISPTGDVTATSTVAIDNSPRNPGAFVINGESNSLINVSLPKSPISITNDKSNHMIVDNWVATPNNEESGICLTDGSQKVLVGATLNIGTLEQNPKGIYTGTYQITFSYN